MRKIGIIERQRMDDILFKSLDYPLTVVSAPAGYGKTTAAKEFLKKVDARRIYLSLTSSDEEVAWQKLTMLIADYSTMIASELCSVGVPKNERDISTITNIIKKYNRKKLILIIDDYQFLWKESIIHKLIETLALEEIDNFFIILLSRINPNIRLSTLISKEICLYIGCDTLAFNYSETVNYLNMKGLRLDKQVVNDIYENTQGWITAIYLLGEGIRKNITLTSRKNINALFEENLLSDMKEEDKEILIRLSGFDSFYMELAIFALRRERVKTVISSLEAQNAFITVENNGEYTFHPLFRTYLQSKLILDKEQKEIYSRACLWYLENNNEKPLSIELFKKAQCIDMLFEKLNFPNCRRLKYMDISSLAKVVADLPEMDCTKYPFPYLQIIFYLFLSGERKNILSAERFVNVMKNYFEKNNSEYRDRILGELIVISRVVGFGRGIKEEEPLEIAAKLFKNQPSETLSPYDPFTFGLPMLCDSEYMKAGELAAAVNRCSHNPYELVTDGFGRGSEKLIAGEKALLTGDIQKAILLAEQAKEEAEEKKQYYIVLSAYFVQMRAALYVGNVERALECMEKIRNISLDVDINLGVDYRMTSATLHKAISLSECFYYTSLHMYNKISEEDIEGISKDYVVSSLGVRIAYCAKVNYYLGNYVRVEKLFNDFLRLPAACQCARLEVMAVSALAKQKLWDVSGSQQLLVSALKQAELDEVILPFAELPELLPLLNRLQNINDIDKQYLNRVLEACKTYILFHPFKENYEKPMLSKREIEILRFTADGSTRREISILLNVKEDTIKKHLQNIYRKLSVSNKIEAIRVARINEII